MTRETGYLWLVMRGRLGLFVLDKPRDLVL